MPTEAQIRITASGVAGVTSQLGQVANAARRVGAVGAEVTRKWKGAFGTIESKFRGLAGLLAAGGIAAGARRVMTYSDSLGQLQADIGLSTKKMREMDAVIRTVAGAHKTDKDALVEALQVYQDFGGIVPQAMTTLGKLAELHKATGAEAKDLATIHSTLIKTLNMSPDAGIEAMRAFVNQSIAGQISLRDLAAVIPNILSSATGFGFKGMRGVHQIGTALQVAGAATGGNAGEAETQVKALMRDLVRGRKKFKGMGVDVLDKKTGQMRDLDQIMLEVMKATKGGRMAGSGGKKGLADVFTQYSMTLASSYGSMYDMESGGWRPGTAAADVMKASQKASPEETRLMYQRRTGGIAKEAQDAKAALESLDSSLIDYGQGLMKWVNQNRQLSVGIAAGAAVMWKSLPAVVGGLSSQFAKRGAGGGGVGGLMGGGATPVYVVNMPSGGIGGGGPGGGVPPGVPQLNAPKGAMFGIGAVGTLQAAGAAFTIGAGIGTALDQELGLSDEIARMAFGKRSDAANRSNTNYGGVSHYEDMRETAKRFLGMQERGVKLGGKGGKEITDKVIAAQMFKAYGMDQGGQTANMDEVLAVLRDIRKGIQRGREKQMIQISNFFGLSDPKVDAGRGPKAGS